MLDVRVFLNASLERVVDELELAHHVVGTLAEAYFNVNAQLLGDFTLAT